MTAEDQVLGRGRVRTREHAERVNEYHKERTDWKGVCQFCKKELRGTVDHILSHSCPEFEESRESSS